MKIESIEIKEVFKNASILKPNFHLNEGKVRITNAIKNGVGFSLLEKQVKKIYTGGIFKRVFVKDKEYGIPYISAQNMMLLNPKDEAKLISRKFTPRQEDMTLAYGQILVSCAGTVGNIRLITKDLVGIIGSQDIIRVISDETKSPFGFIYAYLASPTIYNFIQSYIYGSVVPRIEPKTLSKLPIINFSRDKQHEIHELIIQSSELREKSIKQLDETIKLIDDSNPLRQDENMFIISNKSILEEDKYTAEKRLESDFYQPATIDAINSIRGEKKLLGDLCTDISISNLRGRVFVEKGIPLYTGQSLGLLRPDLSKQLSRVLTKNIAANTTKNNDILLSIFGTLGKVEIAFDNFYTGIFADQHLARIRVDITKIHPGYIYAFLKSKFGNKQLMKFKTGSVIEWVNANNVASLVIPVPKDKGFEIGEKIMQSISMNDKAYKIESKAINIIEEEIESWQK